MLELHLQSILLWLFWRWILTDYLPRLALNHDPPDLSLSRVRVIGLSHQRLALLNIFYTLSYHRHWAFK
jgi:hypothetical protein